MAKHKSPLFRNDGPNAAPVDGLLNANHLRAAVVGGTASAAIAVDDSYSIAALPPNSVFYPALSTGTSGLTAVTVAGNTATLGSGAPIELPNGGEVVAVASGSVAVGGALNFTLVFGIFA